MRKMMNSVRVARDGRADGRDEEQDRRRRPARLRRPTVADHAGQRHAEHAAGQRAAGGPALPRTTSSSKSRLEEPDGAADDRRVVAEQQPAERRDQADQHQVTDAAQALSLGGPELCHAQAPCDVVTSCMAISVADHRGAVADRPEHGQDVFDGRVALDVVDRVEDEPAAVVEDRRSARGPRGRPRPACRRPASSACPRRRPRTPGRRPNSLFSRRGSMSAAEHCTGLRMSKPASMKSGSRSQTLPQEWMNVFHVRLLVDQVVDPLVERLEQVAVGVERDEQARAACRSRCPVTTATCTRSPKRSISVSMFCSAISHCCSKTAWT